MLAKIHIAKKDLGLDDDTYRDFLETLTGKRSASELSHGELDKVVAAFKKEGWQPEKNNLYADSATRQQRMVFALWIELSRAGVIEDNSRAALNTFVKRQTGIDSLTWCSPSDLNLIIEGLKSMCHRHNLGD